jgi:uncharacterized protein
MKSWIQSASGKMIHVLEPRRENVNLIDVAQGLAGKNRFMGQTKVTYSVADHCAIGARWLAEREQDVEAAIGFLLHELGEVYLPDIPAPLKPSLYVEVPWAPVKVTWADLERVHEIAILSGLGMDRFYPAIHLPYVKAMDSAMLRWEARDLLGPPPAPWWEEGAEPFVLTSQDINVHVKGAKYAKDRWLGVLKDLTGIAP